MYLLASLPDSFDTLVTALEVNEEVPKMEVVIERILHSDTPLINLNFSNCPVLSPFVKISAIISFDWQ